MSKNKKTTITKVYYNIKRPLGARKTFQVSQEQRTGTKRVHSKCEDKFITYVNEQFLKNKITQEKAYELLREHFDKLRQQTKTYIPQSTDDGLDKHLLEWREQLLNKRIREEESEYNIIYFSREMGKVLQSQKKTIHSISLSELRKGIELRFKSSHGIKKICAYFNNYLKYSERDIKLDPAFFNGEEHEFYYIESSVFERLCKLMPVEIRVPSRILFYTGLRLGELYGLKPNDWYRKHYLLKVDRQVKKSGKIKKPKCNKQRTTVAPKNIVKDLEIWLRDDYSRINRNTYQHLFRKFCNSNKQNKLRIHDLRHSFAMYCLQEKKLSIDMIAKLIGDRVDICEKHYLGTKLSDKTIQDIASSF